MSPPDLNSLSPMAILAKAQEAVPAVKYAMGVAGVAAAAAIIVHFVGTSSTGLIMLALVFVGMILLFIFSVLINSSSALNQVAGEVLVWAVLIFFVTFMGFTALAFGAGWPCNWAEFVGVKKLHQSCETLSKPISPSSSVEDALPARSEDAAARVVEFEVLVPQDPPAGPAPQIWTRKQDYWEERHPNETLSIHRIVKRISLNRCDGSVSYKEEFPGLEFFVPEKGCPGMMMMFRRDKSPWMQWLPMLKIK